MDVSGEIASRSDLWINICCKRLCGNEEMRERVQLKKGESVFYQGEEKGKSLLRNSIILIAFLKNVCNNF